MLWLRGAIFTLLVPVVVGGAVPLAILDGKSMAGGAWHAGWLAVGSGVAVYLSCLGRFLAAGGTPAIHFTQGLRFLIGEEPPRLVAAGPYGLSRNPMYLAVLLVVYGLAVVFASAPVTAYGLALALFFHLIVAFVEEPHLRRAHGQQYADYSRQVPRWMGWRRGA